MDTLQEALAAVAGAAPGKLVASCPAAREDGKKWKRAVIRRMASNRYQVERYTEKQVFHENIPAEGLLNVCLELMERSFRQLNAWTETEELAVKVTKKGKVLFSRRKTGPAPVKVQALHDRAKQYLIPEGKVIEPLVDMGIFSAEGKVLKPMYDKYKQINRFLEIIDDAVKKREPSHLNIIDFGCGKSYLTFIVYYYLTEIRKISVTMIGLDLKEDVIEACNKAARKYGYEGLSFRLGDINGFQCPFKVDMVVTLHACDTATDYALYNAVSWGADMIFSVPCCQHELNAQLKTDRLSLLTRYGIVKERFSTLLTDAIRGNLLEYAGYSTQILEFVDLSHTPKNLLIRAMKTPEKSAKNREQALAEAKRAMEEFHGDPTLYRLMFPEESGGGPLQDQR